MHMDQMATLIWITRELWQCRLDIVVVVLSSFKEPNKLFCLNFVTQEIPLFSVISECNDAKLRPVYSKLCSDCSGPAVVSRSGTPGVGWLPIFDIPYWTKLSIKWKMWIEFNHFSFMDNFCEYIFLLTREIWSKVYIPLNMIQSGIWKRITNWFRIKMCTYQN
jgi:hypothetical protein